jgi:hypothetical protein
MLRSTLSVTLLAALGAGACAPEERPTQPEIGAAVLHFHGQPTSASANRDLAIARQATAAFLQFERALEAGYDTQFPPGCFEVAEGGQAVHYLNGEYLDRLDVAQPQLLMYEPQTNGSLRLVGIEYALPGDGSEPPPVLFEQQFHYNATFGVWVLHVWIWRHSPNGMFADWNPQVSCAHAQD